jgi:hypothetical protein
MTREGQADAGRSLLPPALKSLRSFKSLKRWAVWGRVAVCATLALGLGAVPAGGLAAASASPVQHHAHGFGGWGTAGSGGFGGFGFGRHVGHVAGEVTGIVSGSEFSLVTARGTRFDVVVSPTTTYSEPGVPLGAKLGFTSLAAGQNVQVSGREASAGTIDADHVKIPLARLFGTVSSVSGTQFTLTSVEPPLTSTSSTVVVSTSTSTLFKEPGVRSPSISNVQVGDMVQVTGTQMGLVSGALTVGATRVVIPLVRYVGTIGNLSAGGFTLTSTSSTVTVTVEVTSTTRYSVPGVSRATIADLSNGQIARVTGDQAGTDKVSATFVQVLGHRHFRGHGRGHNGFGFGSSGPGFGGPGPGAGGQGPGAGGGQGPGGLGTGGGHQHGFGAGGGPSAWGGHGRR